MERECRFRANTCSRNSYQANHVPGLNGEHITNHYIWSESAVRLTQLLRTARRTSTVGATDIRSSADSRYNRCE